MLGIVEACCLTQVVMPFTSQQKPLQHTILVLASPRLSTENWLNMEHAKQVAGVGVPEASGCLGLNLPDYSIYIA